MPALRRIFTRWKEKARQPRILSGRSGKETETALCGTTALCIQRAVHGERCRFSPFFFLMRRETCRKAPRMGRAGVFGFFVPGCAASVAGQSSNRARKVTRRRPACTCGRKNSGFPACARGMPGRRGACSPHRRFSLREGTRRAFGPESVMPPPFLHTRGMRRWRPPMPQAQGLFPPHAGDAR